MTTRIEIKANDHEVAKQREERRAVQTMLRAALGSVSLEEAVLLLLVKDSQPGEQMPGIGLDPDVLQTAKKGLENFKTGKEKGLGIRELRRATAAARKSVEKKVKEKKEKANSQEDENES